jgi:LysM repeat protein
VRVWTKSACVVLAWSVLLILATVGIRATFRPAQANIRSAKSTVVILTSTLGVAAGRGTAAIPSPTYVVQYGDTLAGIAGQLGVRGGWPALYAANRSAIGPNPNIIQPGTVLSLPGQLVPVRYTVAAGDTLSQIAAALGVPGGWPALYAANRDTVGPDPNEIQPGTVLTIPSTAEKPRPRPSLGRHPVHPAPPATSVRSGHRPRPARASRPAAAGMPRWLKTVLLAAGLLIAAAFLAEPVLVIRRRRSRGATLATVPTAAVPTVAEPTAAVPTVAEPTAAVPTAAVPTVAEPTAAEPTAAEPTAAVPTVAEPTVAEPYQRPGSGWADDGGRFVLADYDRLVVARSEPDETVYVLRPPGADPKMILRAARLVLPEGAYGDLADLLGMPASWPIVMADHDRLVVTCSKPDDTVYVLRPPGADPRTILRAARLVLPEGAYGELAEQLGVSADWPME